MKLLSIHMAALAVFALAANAASIPEGKCLLVLQCGSDWCESGEDVRRVFESREFARAVGSDFAFAVYDDMDEPTPAVKAESERLKNLRVESSRFPAITCLTPAPRRFFAQLENIPFDISSSNLAARIAAAAKAKDYAERLFAAARRNGNSAKSTEAYGRAFALLSEQAGEQYEKRLFEGGLAWKGEWDALSKLDSDGRVGWKRRFTAGTGIGWIEKATKFRTDGDFEGGKKFIESLRTFRPEPLTIMQRQAIEIAEYALWRTDETHAESNKGILRRALALGRDTVWGQCALGYLLLSGEKIERRKRRSRRRADEVPHRAVCSPPAHRQGRMGRPRGASGREEVHAGFLLRPHMDGGFRLERKVRGLAQGDPCARVHRVPGWRALDQGRRLHWTAVRHRACADAPAEGRGIACGHPSGQRAEGI